MAAKKIIDGEKSVKITAEDIKTYLGERKILPEKIYESDPVGIVNGMAYNGVGGDLLRVEAVAMPGSGKLELTGSLGDVIKESAHIALSYIRLHAKELGIDPSFYKSKDIHIHFPEGATPKDGPSGGSGGRHRPCERAERTSGEKGAFHDGRDHPSRESAADRRTQGENHGGI